MQKKNRNFQNFKLAVPLKTFYSIHYIMTVLLYTFFLNFPAPLN